MNEQLRTIRLYGPLGARFGRVHHLAVQSLGEAMRALAELLPGFRRELMTSKDRGVGYACFLGRRNLAADRLGEPIGGEEIRIAPMVMGAKRSGLFSIVLGAALLVFAPYAANLAFSSAALGFDAAVGLSSGILTIGASLGKMVLIGGIAQVLSPQQKSLSTDDGPDNGASYNFNGAVNTTAQGNAVPLLYGELIVGSATVSAGIFAEDQA